MDEYVRLKNEIDKYIEKDEIELSNDVISAHDLYMLVDDSLKELREIQFDSNFQKEINKRNMLDRTIKIFKKKKSCLNDRCTFIMASCDGKKSSITFEFQTGGDLSREYFLDVCKDTNNDEIYFSGYNADKLFVERFYDKISEYFATLEKFNALFLDKIGTFGSVTNQTFSDGFFDVNLSYDSYGRVKIETNINKLSDQENIYKRQWAKRTSLSDYVDENQENILKKIPINISELNFTTRTIVENATCNKNIPQLVKRNKV